ncbi:MAG: hypothetical protein JRJ41_05980 [Deltaproteobacteria bacterium]|nr:hypothetical protein [Deltaproteobacteria bacterium]
MSIKFHLYFGMALSAAAFMFVLWYLFYKVGALLAFLGGVLVAYMPRLLFCYWLHPQCPECGGKAHQKSGALIGKDIRYACSSCGYTQQTEAAYRSDSHNYF